MEINSTKNISSNVLEKIKKTKNTSVKNLTVITEKEGSEKKTEIVKNMCQVWRYIKDHYKNDSNLKDKISVFQDSVLLKDIHAEKKASGKVWMVDRMQIGKHVKVKSDVEGKK